MGAVLGRSFKKWRVAGVIIAAALAGCSSPGRQFEVTRDLFGFQDEPPPAPQGPTLRQPVLPEMLVGCRGHVLVPALGMTFIYNGQEPPAEGQYLKEDKLTPPYRILRPGAAISREQSPTRLNVELDRQSRIIGLYCG
jgi:hypothetical protein